MRMTTRTAMAALLISIATVFAGAQEALTLQKARALTQSRSTALRSAELAVDAASLAAQAQGYAALPSITASAGGSFGYEAINVSQSGSFGASAKISASETLFDGGKTFDLVKKYGFATEAARENLRSSRISLIGQAETAFFAILGDQAAVDAAAKDLDAAESLQTIAQAKIDAGSLSKSAYLQTQADTAGYRTKLIIAQKTLGSANAKLASLTGLPSSTSLVQIDFSIYDGLLAKLSSLDEAGIDKLAADIIALAKANSPTLAVSALSSQQTRLDVAIAKTAYLPTIAAGVSQGLSYAQSALSGLYGTTYPGSLSLTATMSLDLWNTKNAIDSADVALAQANLSGNQAETDLELGVVQGLYAWISSAGSIGSAALAAEYAQSNYDNVLERFKLSSATTSDLSTAQALVSADKTALINARFGFLAGLSTLRGLAGLEDEAKLLAAVPL